MLIAFERMSAFANAPWRSVQPLWVDLHSSRYGRRSVGSCRALAAPDRRVKGRTRYAGIRAAPSGSRVRQALANFVGPSDFRVGRKPRVTRPPDGAEGPSWCRPAPALAPRTVQAFRLAQTKSSSALAKSARSPGDPLESLMNQKIHLELARGAAPEQLPVFGCAVSARLQNAVDPLRLVYSRG